MTTNDPDRLDRIESLLERSIIDSNERLSRIEGIVQSNAQIIQSNARSIEAMGTQFEETKRLADRVFQRMDSLTQQLAAIVSSRNEDRDLLRNIKAGIDKLLRRSEQ
ncbi:hypothetical protein [Acaryochloris sp. IP29b_bin.137]|uniref:hypothetical protein n=1 Tax=Acaryochloris sp. IP29b_bin.137 TaxID=2969217 RepID=UPI00260FF6F0|nr:hypothetical protein [Acaryochloris sp. IP29b_bin.137]